uniref:rRNA N-glycosidase n=1 Tax=Oryza punctata TaxID=4537 RepID=A0A0E0KHH8_ORYPU
MALFLPLLVASLFSPAAALLAGGEHGVDVEPRQVEILFDLATQSWYNELYSPLKAALTDNGTGPEFMGHALMDLRDDDVPPSKQITVRLFVGGGGGDDQDVVVDDDDDQAKLLVAEDDAYVAGFANRTGHWHTFRGGRCHPVIPAGAGAACTELPFGGTYRDLIGGVANLRAVPLGRASAASAMRVLSRYDPATTPAADAKMALAKFMMMVTESVRLKAVSRAVGGRWEEESYLSSDEGPPGGEMMMVDLQDYGSGVGTLAVRMDGLSVAGFANRSGHWHALRGNDHLFRFRGDRARAATATTLPFGSSYGDLVGGVKNLPDLPLEEDRATVALSAYDPATATADDEEALRRALATLTVVICETQRLQPVMDTVLMRTGRGSGARVAAEHLPYIEHWDAMWHELKRWRRSGGVWGGPFTGELREKANIGSAKEALAVIGWTFRHMLLRRNGRMAMGH